MQTIRISATKARNQFFSLLDLVSLGKTQVVVEKDSEEVAVITPKNKSVDWIGLKKAMDAASGIFKDYDPEDNPLRKKGAADFLGKWDKRLPTKKGK